MDSEIQFLLEHFSERHPKFLMEHIQSMVSGETPFLPTTLSLVYNKLIEMVFIQPIATGSHREKPTESECHKHEAPATQTNNFTSGVDPPILIPLPLTQQAEPEPEPEPELAPSGTGCP